MTHCQRTQFVAAFGCEKEFRNAFNVALRSAEPRTGYSFSMVVRLALEAAVTTQVET